MKPPPEILLILHLLVDGVHSAYTYVGRRDLQLSQGPIFGNEMSYSYKGTPYLVTEFLSIPFAKPPIGNLRFRRPVRLTQFPRPPVNATAFGPACMQMIDSTFDNRTRYSDKERAASGMWNVGAMSEDCLTLNVWTPYPIMGDRLKPVMMWVYGGGYFSGGSHLEVYQGYRLAALEDVVVVSFNYRVGLFGFMFMDDSQIPGNMGLYDQKMAMEWVRDNIASFGGDPRQVTLLGESAGGGSIGLHMLSPDSSRLFSKAIMESGSPTAPWAVMEREEMYQRSRTMADYVANSGLCAGNQSIFACMRRIPTDSVLALDAALWNVVTERYLPFPIGPVVDYTLIPDKPINLLRQGKFPSNIPVMAGSNQNEGSFWLIYYINNIFNDFQGDNPVTAQQYDMAMKSAFGRLPRLQYEAISFYYRNWGNLNDVIANRIAVDDATGEQNFLCPLNQFAEYISTKTDQVYMYLLTQRSSAENWPEWMGVIHGADCEWVFGKFLDDPRVPQEEKDLNRRIMTYWANFARSGDPNLPGSSEWPKWSNHSQKTLILDTHLVRSGAELTMGPRADRCAFWQHFFPLLRSTDVDHVKVVDISSPADSTFLSRASLATTILYISIHAAAVY